VGIALLIAAVVVIALNVLVWFFAWWLDRIMRRHRPTQAPQK
jgi:hypothetical protein